MWARHTDRWGCVELKVSPWMPDGITTKRGTQATEEVHRFSHLTSLSLCFSPSVTLQVRCWWTRGCVRRQWPFWLLGNLSQVLSMFGTAGMCDNAQYFSPDFTLSRASLPIKYVPANIQSSTNERSDKGTQNTKNKSTYSHENRLNQFEGKEGMWRISLYTDKSSWP